MSLNDKQCKNLAPKDKPYKISDGHGLFLYVSPTGYKTWRFKYRFNNKQKDYSIGQYPTVGLAEARKILQDLKEQLRQGIDPAFSKKELKLNAKLNSEDSFESIAREWHSLSGLKAEECNGSGANFA